MADSGWVPRGRFALSAIHQAQQEFASGNHVGTLVIVPIGLSAAPALHSMGQGTDGRR